MSDDRTTEAGALRSALQSLEASMADILASDPRRAGPAALVPLWLNDIRAALAMKIAQPSEPGAKRLTLCLQTIMADLADLLDADQFNNIEGRVIAAGVSYPPLGTDPRTLVEPHGWLPIETAPRDGSYILLGYFSEEGGEDWEVAFWHGRYSMWCGRGLLKADGSFSPTHWQALSRPSLTKDGGA